MKDKIKNQNLPGKEKVKDPEGYPVYPESEDIYNKYREEREIDPEDISKTKALHEN